MSLFQKRHGLTEKPPSLSPPQPAHVVSGDTPSIAIIRRPVHHMDHKHSMEVEVTPSNPTSAATQPDSGQPRGDARTGLVGQGGSSAATTSVLVSSSSGQSLANGAVARRTTRYGSKYEKARLLGEWATQICMGADPCVDLGAVPEKERERYSDPLALAEKALEDKTMPLGIRRFLLDGKYEDWFLDDLVFLS
jgi:DNA-directed RNA polymerase subunit K/omega